MMKRLFLIFLSALSILSVATSTFAQSQTEHPAATVAKSYMEILKGNKIPDSVMELWDLDSLMTSSFGLMYLDLPSGEKTATQRAFANFLAASFSNPKVARFVAELKIQSAKTKIFSESLVAVTLELTGQNGQFNAVNTLLLSKAGNTWRIVDQRQNSSMPIRSSIVLMWAEERGKPNATIASVLENAAAELRRQASGGR